MKRRVRRLLSLLMAALMIMSCMSMTVLAEETGKSKDGENQKILISSTSDTIVLSTEEGYEYAIRMDEDGIEKWKWADKKQYDRDDKTVTFSELNPETEYHFARRLEKDADLEKDIAEEDIMTFSTAAKDSQPEMKEPETKAPETKAPETKAPETKAPETKAPETKAPETKAPETKAPETKAPETKAPEAKAPETKAPETKVPETKAPEAKAPETKAPETKETEIKVPETDAMGTKEEQTKVPDTPKAPVLVQVTDTTIDVSVSSDADSKYTYEYSIDGKVYTTTSKFIQLKPDSDYEITVRVKAGTYDGEEYSCSSASDILKVHTLKSAFQKPEIPAVASRTDTVITFASDENLDYGIVGSDGTIRWQKNSSFENLSPGTGYNFIFRLTYDSDKQMPSENSDGLSIKTLQSAAAAPDAPVIKERTETSITVNVQKNQEYALVIDGKAQSWQSTGEFSGLKPNTSYSIVTRVVYDPQVAMESKISDAVTTKTIIAFSDSSISGIAEGAVYDAGSSFTVTALGSGMKNNVPVLGDSRWKPLRWEWGSGAKGSWDKAPYTTSFSVKEAGKYTLNIIYGLEIYTEKGWENAGTQNSLKVSFTVVAKEFTLKATYTKGGTISPSGTIKTTQGKDYTITMTADKNHKIYKVYIDGKETPIKGTKYTFNNVNADHTIHVVFEKSGKIDAPKTGDDTNPWILWSAIGICAVIIIAIIILKISGIMRKK